LRNEEGVGGRRVCRRKEEDVDRSAAAARMRKWECLRKEDVDSRSAAERRTETAKGGEKMLKKQKEKERAV